MDASAVRGTQTLARAVVLMKAVATRPQQGWRLTDLAAHCGFDKGSAHRLLAGLAHERLVVQRRGDRHYLPGPLLFELGLGVAPLAGFQARCAPGLARLARATRGIAFLYLKSGHEFVCAARVGNTTLKGMSVEVGTRRPLVVSAAGVAILLALPAALQQPLLQANLRQIESFGAARVAAVRKMLRRSRRHGFGVNLGDVVPGINAFGVPLFDADGEVFASLSVVGPDHAMPRARMAEFEAMLRDEARRIGHAGTPPPTIQP
jgi:DNA-binding IclR family transcriptional regulator